MPRKMPACPDSSVLHGDLKDQRGTYTTRSYAITLITPLFGGGPVQQQRDQVTPIRGASIRGHLRFWWRASRGACFSRPDELRRREGEIWGTAQSASPVRVRVAAVRVQEESPWAEYRLRPDGKPKAFPDPIRGLSRSHQYALFPFAGKPDGSNPPATAIMQASFELVISYPSKMEWLQQEVEAALWAWVTLGGIGSRTRRGCGSLYCREFAPCEQDVQPGHIQRWYEERLRSYNISVPNEARGWPVLPRTIMVSSQRLLEPWKAWGDAVDLLRRFRQDPVGRNGLGRSHWPEADSLRRITEQSHPRHRVSLTGQHNAFPRAAFGMPIIFHFKDGNAKSARPRHDRDPVDCTLKPADGDRMASPLILKALAISAGKDIKAVPMVCLLHTSPLEKVLVECQHTKQLLASDSIRHASLSQYAGSPMARRSATGDALEAFLAFVKESWGNGRRPV